MGASAGPLHRVSTSWRVRPKPARQAGRGIPRCLGDDLGGDGRATFEYGDEIQPGEAHIIWRRIGTHSVFRQP
jgi:hypothetical protein